MTLRIKQPLSCLLCGNCFRIAHALRISKSFTQQRIQVRNISISSEELCLHASCTSNVGKLCWWLLALESQRHSSGASIAQPYINAPPMQTSSSPSKPRCNFPARGKSDWCPMHSSLSLVPQILKYLCRRLSHGKIYEELRLRIFPKLSVEYLH